MKYKDVLAFAREMRKNPTPAERYFWEKVRQRRFMGKKFYRQYIIQYAEIQGKKAFFIPDFYCHENKLVIEIDGSIHSLQKEYDKLREKTLLQMGYSIIRFNNEIVLGDWPKVEAELEEALRQPSPSSQEGDKGGVKPKI